MNCGLSKQPYPDSRVTNPSLEVQTVFQEYTFHMFTSMDQQAKVSN